MKRTRLLVATLALVLAATACRRIVDLTPLLHDASGIGADVAVGDGGAGDAIGDAFVEGDAPHD